MKRQAGFAGFAEKPLRSTPVPNPFFSELLPQLDDLNEIKITLYVFWALARKQGRFRYACRSEMLDDDLLLVSMVGEGTTPAERVDEALERAVSRGTLLQVTLALEQGEERFYFLNSAKGRAAVQGLETGAWVPSGTETPLDLRVELPNIFTLYEQNIGPLTPLIAETLREAEGSYPGSWIREAFTIAVENNVRKWRYIEAILEDWRTRGRDEREDRGDTEKARRRYIEGEFADFWDD